MGTIFIILLILIGLFIVVRFIYYRFVNTKIIRSYFNQLSITVCGKRGTGKDTLFSYITYKTENNSNIIYNKNTNLIKLNDLMIPGLSREKLVLGVKGFTNFSKYSHFDNDTFISDANIYFPNYEDAQLKKEYSSLPISIALWRHLYNGSLHFNCQVNSRLWKLIREQIEDTIMCLGSKRGLLYTKLKLRYYERPEDAEKGLKPLEVGFFKKMNADIKIENSKRWEIKDYTLLIPNRMVTHDTRYFKNIIFKKGEQNEFI